MLTRGARVLAVEPQVGLARELQRRFPDATIAAVAVSDEAGEATLHTRRHAGPLASLDAGWDGGNWDNREIVPVTTLEALIAKHGQPALIKIDTEGFDHRVIRGLKVPVGQILFEVHADHAADAAEALRVLDALGRYEYRLEKSGSWLFSEPMSPDQIVATISGWDLHA